MIFPVELISKIASYNVNLLESLDSIFAFKLKN